MNKIKVGAKIKVNAENPTTAHTLARCVQPTVDSSTSTRRRKPKAE